MDILSSILFIILFIILMIFIFSIGMLRPFMPKKEMAFVLIVAFFIGALGGAFFLNPIYEELPNVLSTFEKLNPSNKETLYLDVSSASDINSLEKNLTSMEGVESFEVTGITFNLWKLNKKEVEYFDSAISVLDSHYTNWTVNSSGKIHINIEKGYDSSKALKSFSDWYSLVYESKISYALVHIKVVVKSSQVDNVKETLLKKDIVPLKIEGPVQHSLDNTHKSMLNYNEFVLASGIFGLIICLMGIYFDNVIVGYRKLKKFIFKR